LVRFSQKLIILEIHYKDDILPFFLWPSKDTVCHTILQPSFPGWCLALNNNHVPVFKLVAASIIYTYCSLSLWRVVWGSKLMHLDLIHGLFIT
jgi:hypothetical protein